MDYNHLRSYQQIGYHNTVKAVGKTRRVLIYAPTGAGKTTMASYMIQQSFIKGHRALVMMDRERLINQWASTLKWFKTPHGFIKAGFKPDPRKKIQLSSWQTLQNRRIPNVDIVFVDEAHEWLDQQIWLQNKLGPKTYFVGMTATPWRGDGRSLGEAYNDIVIVKRPAELIAEGYLVDSKIYAPAPPDMSKARKSYGSGDYIESDIENIMSTKEILAGAVKHYREKAHKKKAFVYCVNKKHARKVKDAFNAAGYRFGLVVDETKEEDRDKQIHQMLNGELDGIVNVYIFVKGTDVPALECMVDMCPTLSVSKYIQMAGRFARPYEGKDYFTQLDMAGNSIRHGSFAQSREISLEVNERGQRKEAAKNTKICQNCFLVVPSEVKQCPACDYIFESNEKEIEEIEGELKEKILEEIVVNVGPETASYKTQGVHFTLPLPSDNFSRGKHIIKREDSKYNYYGKLKHSENHREAVLWLLDMTTGSKNRNMLISYIRLAEKKGHNIRSAYYKYKKKTGRWPKMHGYN